MKKFMGMSKKEIISLSDEDFLELMRGLTTNEIIKLSGVVGYPVFTRLCMGELKHRFVLLQDGAAAVIVNEMGQILLQRRSDRDEWGLPGGCQELGETFEEAVIREVKEETNLDVKEEDLKLIKVVSGMSRKSSYPNGDVVINNTVLYLVDKYSGTLRWNYESKDMKFFDLNNLPFNQHDPDLVDAYIKYLNK